MADFVGLLKKTIESQSQMTPQLRQRIYERARATVERKLTDSRAPAPIVERQREILGRAIEEVEAYYRERDETISEQEPEQNAPLPHDEPSLAVETGETQAEPAIAEDEEVAAVQSLPPPAPIGPDLSSPPPFEEAFAREESQTAIRGADGVEEPSQPATPVVAAPLPSPPPSLEDDSLKELLQPAAPEAIGAFAAPPSNIKPEIPSLASLFNGEEAATPPPAADELPPLDLPFLGSDGDGEDEAAPLEALESEQISHTVSVQEVVPEVVENKAKSPFEDYLPHWTEDEKPAPTPPPAYPATLGLASFSSPSSFSLPEIEISDTRAESEIDRARREIEALRARDAGADPVNPHAHARHDELDEQPFSPLDLPPLPVEPLPQALATDETEERERIASNEAAFNNDLVSEIFVQAAKREQKQSNKKRRLAALVIGAIVLAVFATIGGLLILMNEYQVGDSVGQRPGQATTSPPSPTAEADSNGNDGQDGAIEADATDADAQKITRRLLPNGQEDDPGLAIDNATPGEGSSQASATLPQVDNSARAVFYEAPTDISSSTANDGRVDWSLRRMPTSSTSGQGQEELAIVGDIKIPALDMTLRLTLRRNHDGAVPADYLAEIVFALPDDFEGEAIDEIGPVLFKASEQSTGQELAGTVTAKVQDNLFLMAVRAPGPILDRNLTLMRQLPWLKLNVLYKNGRVGEFSIAKGEGGQRIFQQVIDEWSKRMASEFSPGSGTIPETISPADEAAPQEPTLDLPPLSSDDSLPDETVGEGEEPASP